MALSEYLERLLLNYQVNVNVLPLLVALFVNNLFCYLMSLFSALDPALRIEMLALLEQLCREKALTLLMVSHGLEDAAKIASRAIVIDNGMIVYDGNTQSLINGGSGSITYFRYSV